MRLFWAITSLSLRRHLTYRAATWAGLITNVFFGLLRAVVLVALFGEQDVVAGMTLQDAITYTGLSQAVIAYLMIFGWYEVMASVYTGEIAVDLLRPLGYFRYWLAIDLGRALVALVLRGVTIMLVYAIFIDIVVPAEPYQWFALLIAIGLSWLVSFSYRFLVNLAAFWTPNAGGIGRGAFGIVWIMSGFYMPLRIYPEWFQTLCRMTPFPSMVNIPVEIYLGLVRGPDILLALLNQLIWTFALIILGQIVFRRGIHRLVIQGG